MLDRERFDVLHFHEPFVPFLSLFLLRLSTSVNIATFHAYAGFSPSYEFGSRALRGHATRLHGRIAVSAAARHFIDRFFPGDYKVIPNGVDVGRFANAVPIARWQDGTPNVLFVGRHEPRKGLLDLLKAHRILRKTGSSSRLLIVGSGPQEREARRYVATRGLQGVEFLGRVSDAEKAQLYKTADVYASPATGGESFGIVLLEAMAAGTPIVASDIHGYKGVVRRGREGLLVPPREPRELADRDRPAAARPGAARADGRRRAGARRGVLLAARHGQGRGLLRLRDPPAGRDGDAAGGLPGGGASGAAAAACQALGRGVRAGWRRPSRRHRSPEPALARDSASASRHVEARIGHDQAGRGDRDQERREDWARERRVRPSRGVHRELERVEVGRQEALVRVDDRRWQRQRGDVRVPDDEPGDRRDAEPDHEPAGVPGGEHLAREVGERQQGEQRDRLDRDPLPGAEPEVRQDRARRRRPARSPPPLIARSRSVVADGAAGSPSSAARPRFQNRTTQDVRRRRRPPGAAPGSGASGRTPG